ncbi:hypothetical protein BJX99DRAFT_226173 [Aspergillus californicus]
MLTPERKSGQTTWARRQQQQQQLTSPFRRARRDPLRLDVFDGLSPPRESSARHQSNISQTGTLRGAFESTSHLPRGEEDIFLAQRTRRTSPRKRRPNSSAMSSHSNPPDELAESYRQIEDENSLTDLDPSDNENVYTSNPVKPYRRTSAAPSRREQRLSTASDTSFTGESPRRQFSNYTRDEERLKRATTNRSPVLGRGALGAGPPSEHLQRRNESYSVSEEDDYGIKPRVNVPSNWGSKAKSSNNWIKNLTRNHERTDEPTTNQPGESSADQVSSSLSARQPAESAETNRSRSGSSRSEVLSPSLSTPSKPNEEYGSEGQAIPNTPIVVYSGPVFTKRSPSKRDSHDLLRKLARNGSPSQQQSTDPIQTPAPAPVTSGRRVYEETPAPPGAFINTPMTQRVPASRPAQPIRALEPNLDKAWERETFVEKADRIDEKAETEESTPNFEPLKGKAGESLVSERPQETQVNGTIPEVKDEEEEKPPIELPIPDHPKSALETVLQDHKNNKDSLDVGDDTIESLQALLDQQPADDTAIQQEEDAAYEQQVIGQLESEQTAETSTMNDFERIEGKLQSLSDTMTHLKSGLNQLGNRVSRDTETIIASLSKDPVEPANSKAVKSSTGCECVTVEHSIIRGIPLPQLWNKGDAWWKVRPTRLGWCALIALVWYLSESTMCDYYCHPFFSASCEGNCLDPNAPRFPYVIPTMISRWLHFSDILLPLWTIIIAFFRLFAQLLGLSDGYVDDVPRTLNLSGKVWVEGTQVGSFPVAATPATMENIPPAPQWAWREETHQRYPDPLPDIHSPTQSSGETVVQWDDLSMDEDEYL